MAGLVVGALLAHLGWCALHAEQVVSRPLWLLDPLSGQSLLFVPLGPLLLAHWSRMEGRDDDFLAASFRALPFALATARAGCVAAGCCEGVPLVLPCWMVSADEHRHPVAVYEIVCWLLLGIWLARRPTRVVVPAFPIGFGALRLLVEPLRAAVDGLEAWPPVWLIALGWLAWGLGAFFRLHYSSRDIAEPGLLP